MNEPPATPESAGAPAGEARDQATAEADRPVRKGKPREFGGPKGPEPTRYGDWERNGRCVDF